MIALILEVIGTDEKWTLEFQPNCLLIQFDTLGQSAAIFPDEEPARDLLTRHLRGAMPVRPPKGQRLSGVTFVEEIVGIASRSMRPQLQEDILGHSEVDPSTEQVGTSADIDADGLPTQAALDGLARENANATGEAQPRSHTSPTKPSGKDAYFDDGIRLHLDDHP